jgi:protein-S-isoprenylcysteine O-methyltransferase Ste14
MTPLFSLVETVIFWVILVGFYVAVGIVVGVLTGQKTLKERGKRKKEPFSPFLLIAWMAVAIIIGYARIGVLPDWLFYPGEILFVVGYGLTIYSIYLLGRYYSTYVEIQADHKVIERGPYRFIRHPNYLGQIVGTIGLGLALQSWVALLVFLVVGSIFFAYRIRNEEAFLVVEIPGYSDYMKRTKRLIPFVF